MIRNRLWILAMLLLPATASAAPPNRASHSIPRAPAIFDYTTHMDANNLDMVVTNFGSIAYDLLTGNAGLIYPKGTTRTVVFAAGPWIGAKVGGETRIATGQYFQEFVPGPMRDGTFQPDQADFKSYKIERGNTTSPDYLNWPTSQGAPLDKDGKPLLLGDVTIWSVYNDADPSRHGAMNTLPLGIEIQQTTFAFNRSGALGNVIFLRFKVSNKGENSLEDVYFSLWSDPDLGDFRDDLAGCDTTLSMGYCYNATNSDAVYGAQPPAVGFCLLRGPAVPASAGVYDTLGMSSFIRYTNGGDPFLPDDYYNYMRGLHTDGTPIHAYDDPGQPTTTYQTSGDPVTGTGWLDSAASDRRMMLSTGPFSLSPGRTHEIAVAVLVGQGSDRLSSLSDLRNVARVAKVAYRSLFPEEPGLPPPSYLTQWGSPGTGDGQFDGPAGIATGPGGNVFIVDGTRIQKFTGAGTFLTKWGSFGFGDGQFSDPFGVATDSEGHVFVADELLNRIQKFTDVGTFLSRWGLSGSGNGEFHNPAGVATDRSGNVYVVDYSNDRIQKFSGEGVYMTQWGSHGSGDGQFRGPTTVAVDGAGNVCVADRYNQRIQKFTNEGAYLTQWGSFGGGNGQFNDPTGVATDAGGNVYVADTKNHRIQKFDGSGTYMTQWGSYGSGDGQFIEPSTLATDAAGNVFVVDYRNLRVQKFGAGTSELEAGVDLDPNIINLKSHAPWVTAYVEAPGSFSPTDIDVSTVRLAGSVAADPKFAVAGGFNSDGKPVLKLRFSRQALDPLLAVGMNQLEVTGSLVTGQAFKGSDEVRVINPPGARQRASVTPNPLNPVGVLTFNTTRSGPVTIKLYDPQGALVRTLIQSQQYEAGQHGVLIDGKGEGGQPLASGVYFFRVEGPGRNEAGRVAILK